MTLTNLADPVDFEAFGDYAPPTPKASPSGAWSHSAADPAAFQRPKYRFQGRITADGSSGYLAEPGRYHLYISWACPWAAGAKLACSSDPVAVSGGVAKYGCSINKPGTGFELIATSSRLARAISGRLRIT
jgi:hypothetical protein